ncbi:HAMP domain-containing sensor histidine kinase [Bacillus tuaregi]|uniref:HAMP domain-containing sensor histidine kinase n=1 Tax=Bacillus tuaregi TaxID=1816695 RepID=UPI0008F8B9D1|nr:HAMP domain-containing sensor histidine kinase [Bacillus tuaregi]
MKIKYWLMLSYFIVMLLPVAALFTLYFMISEYDKKQDLIEFMEVRNTLTGLEPILEDIQLYEIQNEESYEHIEKQVNESIKISLYRQDGVTLYSSIQEPFSDLFYQTNLEKLYENLNEVQKNLRTYSYKKPVFDKGVLVGIYEVTIGREKWIEMVQKRSLVLGILFLIFFTITYTVVVILLNRKLNRPLQQLRTQMTAFANGQTIQEPVRHSKDEIGEVLQHFYQMKDQIEQARKELANQQKEKEFIVASLTHDLKTPLTVIQAYAEALENQEQLSAQERQEYQTILFEKLSYMKQMLDDLGVYTALQSSREEVELVIVDGDEFFDMLLAGYEEPCRRKGIVLQVEQAVESYYEVSVKHMVRIVDNLMTNGIRHTKEGRHIWLGAISSSETLPNWIFPPFYQEVEGWRQDGTLIIIQNEGIGIPKDLQDRMFQPFVQGEDARGQGGSSGLGLSVAKILIEKHSGKIKLWSAEGYGTLVACWLQERESLMNEN